MKELNQWQNHKDKLLIKLIKLNHNKLMFHNNKLMFQHHKHMSKVHHMLILIKLILVKIINQQQHMFKVIHKKFPHKVIINHKDMLHMKQERLEKVMDILPIQITSIEIKVIIYYKYF